MAKKITAQLISRWFDASFDEQAALQQFDDLRYDFGAALPFFANPHVYCRFPFSELGEPRIDIANLAVAQGEAWVLFCYSGIDMANTHDESLLRSDGFMLPFEWRKNTEHSGLIPESMHKLAEEVISAVGANSEDKWGLHPSFQRFGDKYDFSDEKLFGGNVGSAWGALAVGLESARSGYVPASWPFCSLQLDPQTGKAGHVEGISRKLSVAGSYNCREFVVASSQVAEATQALADLRQRNIPGSDSIIIVAADSRQETLVSSLLYSQFDWLKPAVSPCVQQPEFIGRQWLVDRVMADGNDAQTTVISGLPGTGKSALLGKVAELAGDSVIASYACSQRPALDFVKTLAYQIALKFPEAFRAAGVDRIRAASEKEATWENIKEFYQAAVCEPLKKHTANSAAGKCPYLIIIDALDETPDRNVVKLLSEADTQLPAWVRVVISTRPLKDIQQLLSRIPLQRIDLDANDNAQYCREDLDGYIQYRLSQSDLHASSDIVRVLESRCISYRYAYNAFLNIKNGTYSLDNLAAQLPDGVQGHYLAFFDSHLSEDFETVTPLLEILAASPIPLSQEFVSTVLKRNCADDIAKLNGYVVTQGQYLSLCDYVFREWLLDREGNSDFHIDVKSGHKRLAQYGWPLFCTAVSNSRRNNLSGNNFEFIKHELPIELQETLGQHVARSSFIATCEEKEYAPVLLAIEHNPENRAAIANAVLGNSAKNGVLSKKTILAAVVVMLAVLSTIGAFNYFSQKNDTTDDKKMDLVRKDDVGIWASAPYSVPSRKDVNQTRRVVSYIAGYMMCLDQQYGAFDSYLNSLSDFITAEENGKKIGLQQLDTCAKNAISQIQLFSKQINPLAPDLLEWLQDTPLNAEDADALKGFANLCYEELKGYIESLNQMANPASVCSVKNKKKLVDLYRQLNRENATMAWYGGCEFLAPFNHRNAAFKQVARDILPMCTFSSSLNLLLLDNPDECKRLANSAFERVNQIHLKIAMLVGEQQIQVEKMEKELMSLSEKHQQIENMKKELAEKRKAIEEKKARMRENCTLFDDDEQPIMWGKIIHLMAMRMYDDVEKQLDNYLKFNVEKMPHVEAVVKAAKAYVAEARKSSINYGIMVHFIENDANHSFLQPGDIITHVDGNIIRDDAAYIALRKKKSNKFNTFEFLRLDNDGKLKKHTGSFKSNDPRFGFSEMVERIENENTK